MSNLTLSNSLNSILDVAKTSELSAQEIEYLWLAKHTASDSKVSAGVAAAISPSATQSDSNSLVAVIPKERYQLLEKLIFPLPGTNAKGNTQFVLPTNNTAKKQLDIHYLQWQIPPEEPANTTRCLVIKLEDFQRHGALAEPHSVIFFYKDFVNSKGIVLMKGEILNKEKISVSQLQFLILNVQKFYGLLDEKDTQLKNKRVKLLLGFNKGDQLFDFNELVKLAMNTN